MTSSKIHVMSFPPPIKYNDAIHKIILAHQIKENAGLDIQYNNIDYIIGNVWNKLTQNFEPGPGANIIINKNVTQNDINNINNAHRKDYTSGLIFLLGHKDKFDYNNNNWYRNDIENIIAFDRFTIPNSLTNTQTINGKQTKYDNNWENHLITNKNTKIINTNIDEKTSIKTKGKSKFKHNVIKNLNIEIKHNIQYNKKLNEILNDNITNITNTSIKLHPDDIKVNTKSDKETNDNKDASIVSNPNDKTLKYNKSEDENSLKINKHDKKSQIHSNETETETNSNGTTHSNIKNINTHSNVTHTTPHVSETIPDDNTSIVSDLNEKKFGKILGDDKKLCNALSTKETHPNSIYTETHSNKKTHPNVPYSTHTSSHTNTNGNKQLLNDKNHIYKKTTASIKLNKITLKPSLPDVLNNQFSPIPSANPTTDRYKDPIIASCTPQIPNTTLIHEKLNDKIYIPINEKIDVKCKTITPKDHAFLRALTHVMNTPISTLMTEKIKIC